MHRAMEAFWRVHLPQEFLDVAFVVTPEELAALVRRELSAKDVTVIRERLKGYGLFNGRVHPLVDLQRALSEAGVHLDDHEAGAGVSEVRGTTAQPGRVFGLARIVIKKTDLEQVQPGDVIVAEMTNPDYVPWMKRAAAFVTDEGGMTCHAGIVARELGKPCVVGTKIATKVFKDGDMLEVDAMNGLVRRL
jgi:pyruvate,water dikinase